MLNLCYFGVYEYLLFYGKSVVWDRKLAKIVKNDKNLIIDDYMQSKECHIANKWHLACLKQP